MFSIGWVAPVEDRGHGPVREGLIAWPDGTHERFLSPVAYWSVADYERQWNEGLRRLVDGATVSALMTKVFGGADGCARRVSRSRAQLATVCY